MDATTGGGSDVATGAAANAAAARLRDVEARDAATRDVEELQRSKGRTGPAMKPALSSLPEDEGVGRASYAGLTASYADGQSLAVASAKTVALLRPKDLGPTWFDSPNMSIAHLTI